jgi:hypothetical protein
VACRKSWTYFQKHQVLLVIKVALIAYKMDCCSNQIIGYSNISKEFDFKVEDPIVQNIPIRIMDFILFVLEYLKKVILTIEFINSILNCLVVINLKNFNCSS